MIDINLIPPHLRKQKKGKVLGTINIPLEIIVGCGGGLLFLLAMIHVVLLLINIGKITHHKGLQLKWEAMAEDKESVDSVVNTMRSFQGKYSALDDLSKQAQFSWAEKLNILSDYLPRGVWFQRIALDDEMLFIEGSSLPQGLNELAGVSQLITDLKSNEDFMTDFTDMELGSIQKRRIKTVEITDFVITMKLK